MAAHDRLIWIPEPWHGRVTARRFRRWLHATRGVSRHNARLPADAPILNFYPMRPQPHAPITTILGRLGVRIGYEPRADQPTIAWDGDTWFSPRAARRLPADAINGRCLDISKGVVDACWEAVSGRSLSVDPLTTHGPIVVKPEENGHHAGWVADGPLEHRRRGFVYQRLLDSREGDWIKQSRPVIIGGEIAVSYEKWRRYPDRFYGTARSLPCAPDALYSKDEQEQLLAFARMMGMDYGELDVMRDPESGALFVVDANRTPSRAHNLPAEHEEAAYGPMTDAFARLLRLDK